MSGAFGKRLEPFRGAPIVLTRCKIAYSQDRVQSQTCRQRPFSTREELMFSLRHICPPPSRIV